MSRVLKDESELQRAIEAMRRFCEMIDDPLADPQEVKETIWRLNATAELVQVYSRGKEVQAAPSRTVYYKEMGWGYQDFTELAETPQPAPASNTPTHEKQAPEQQTEPPKTASKVSSWLDD